MKKLLGWLFLAVAIFSVDSARAASSLDPTFNPGIGANGIVEQVLPLSNGKILICGNFTAFNGQNKAYMARLNADGSVDNTFTGQASYWVRNMSVQPDGKIVVGGFFKNVGPTSRSLIARLNSDGSLDPSFDPGLGCTDSLGTAIDGNADPFVFWTAIQPDGKILITGNFRNYNGAPSSGIVRVNPDGSRDASFNVGGGLNSWGRSIRLQGNGQIVLSGWFDNYNGNGCNRLVRINPDGSMDLSFLPYFGDRTAIYSTVDVGGGKMVVSGHSLSVNNLFTREMERLNPDGTVDSSFVGYTNEKTESLAVQPDGKIILGGYFTAVDGQPRTSLARMNPDGTLDNTLVADINNYVWSVALQSDGKLLASGGFYMVDGQPRSGVARFLTGVSSTPPPPSPVLSATANSSTQVTLNWSDSAMDRNGYSVERKTGANGTYASIATLAGSARSYVNSGLAAGTQYYFRLRATTSSGAVVYSNESAATTSPGAGGTAVATFVGADRTTHGTWKGVYGSAGYNVLGSGGSYPAGVSVSPLGKSDWVWQYSTTDVDALQKWDSTSDRIAACWYAAPGFTLDISVASGMQQRMSLYLLDWDVSGRVSTAQLVDGDTGAILNSQTVSAFDGGVYLTWDIQGHVKVNLSSSAGPNAVVSGIFFGGGGATGGGGGGTVATPTFSPSGGRYSSPQSVTISTSTAGAEIRYTTDGSDPTGTSTLYTGALNVASSMTIKAKAFKSGMTASAVASATYSIGTTTTTTASAVFVKKDTTTSGSWRGVYGSEGYYVIGSSASNPTYGTVGATAESPWTWNSSTTDARALQTASGASRIAACWYSSTSFTVNVNLTGTGTHRLAIYLLDWDFNSRVQTVEVLDASSGAVLNTQTVSGFSGGHYLVWDVKGAVKLRFTRGSGPNAVVNGIFFGPTTTQL